MGRAELAGARLLRVLPVVAAVGVVAAVFFPITRAYFHQDDFLDLQAIANGPALEYILRPSAGHVYILRNSIFWLGYELFGAEPVPLLTFVLLLHLGNVALLWDIVRRLTGGWRAATFAAVLWGVAPVHEHVLAWWAVFGQVLATTFLLLVLRSALRLWSEDRSPAVRHVAVWSALLLLGAMSFGIGVGLALAFPIVVLLLFPRGWARLAMLALPPVVLAGYWAAYWLYARHYGDPVQANVLFLVALLPRWHASVAMVGHMVVIGVTALVGSFAWTTRRYPDAFSVAVGGLFVVALIGGLITARPRERRVLLALVVVTLSAYTIIAVGRANFYAGMLGVAGAAAEGRYFYVATIPVGIILAWLAGRFADALRMPGRLRTVAWAGWATLTVVLYVRSGWRPDTHEYARIATVKTLAKIAHAVRNTQPGMPVFVANKAFPIAYADSFAGWAAIFTIHHPDGIGRPVYFVDRNPDVLSLARPGSPLENVLISPAQREALRAAVAGAGVGDRAR